MSSNFSRATRLAMVLGVGTLLVGCQDAVAPIADEGPSGETPNIAMSRGVGQEKQLIKDQYIVVFRDEYNDVDARSKRLMAGKSGKIRHVFKSAIKGFVGVMTAAEAAALTADPGVAYVEQDQIVTAQQGKGGKNSGTISEPKLTSQRKAPWALDRVDQSTLPLNGTYTYGPAGQGVNVYVVDSGIRLSHGEFGGRATLAFSAFADSFNTTGCSWHGTHVAAIVAGQTYGVAKSARVHSVRVLGCDDRGYLSDVIAGIDWITANRVLPAVANISIAGGASTAHNEAVERAILSGVTVVVAAGNNAYDACAYSPASAPNAITVGSTGSLDIMSAFSNHGSCVDILAPGENVVSASHLDDRSTQVGSGTSMAAPHVAGAAALLLEASPHAPPTDVFHLLIRQARPNIVFGVPGGTPNSLLQTR